MKKKLLFPTLLLLLSSPLFANQGEALYKQCILCHGANGEGKPSEKAPQIAGQFDWYIKKAINDFKSGARKNPVMLPYIKNLSPSDIDQLAKYISQLKVQ